MAMGPRLVGSNPPVSAHPSLDWRILLSRIREVGDNCAGEVQPWQDIGTEICPS